MDDRVAELGGRVAMRKMSGLGVLLAGMVVATGWGQGGVVAPRPPMGWNSWDAYGLTVDEKQYRDNVEVMAAKLKKSGWEYAVIDEGWYLDNVEDSARPETLRYHRDAQGRYVPTLKRFPSAVGTDSFKPLSDYVHGRGLKFGIHIIRGIPKATVAANGMIAGGYRAREAAEISDTCPWNVYNYGVKENAAGQAWYDSLMGQYADWGVDYLKVDCISSHPYKGDEIRMIHKAIAKATARTGRAMVLSLSPGPTLLENADEVKANAQLWRISDDLWDKWEKSTGWAQGVKDQFPLIEKWAGKVGPGSWPDADMLPVGELRPVPGDGSARTTGLTHEEQRTLLTLWAVARSPLFIGANLTLLDDWTLGLLTNPGVIAANQEGSGLRMARSEGDVVTWTSQGLGGKSYLAVFNLGESAVEVKGEFAGYGLAGKRKVRDVWEGKELGVRSGVGQVVAGHGCLLWELR